MAAIPTIQKDDVYHTSEIIVNSSGRILTADRQFCEIMLCKSPNAMQNLIILEYVVEQDRKKVVNAFIDTFYGNQIGKLFEIRMINYLGKEIDVTFNFFPIKSSNGEKATLLIRKKMF